MLLRWRQPAWRSVCHSRPIVRTVTREVSFAAACRIRSARMTADDEPMRVLTTRGGELAVPFPPICDDGSCPCHVAAGLDSGCPVQTVTVADRDDVSADQLRAGAAELLHYLWAPGLGVDATAELAAGMADEALEAAAEHPPGTRLRPHFDSDGGAWTYTKAPS